MDPTLIIGTLLNFGALLVPTFYLLITRFRGPATKHMLICLALQIFWSLCVWGLVAYLTHAGRSDAAMGWSLLLPVNFVSLLFYIGIFVVHARKARRP